MNKRRRGIFVTGTDTDVGKTQVASGLAAALRLTASRHWPEIRLWKPVQSGVRMGSPDADSSRLLFGGGSGYGQKEEDIASVTLPEPLAPWMAARRAGKEIDFERLAREGSDRLEDGCFWIVEGAGGLAVPLTERHLVADLAAALGLPLLIVARPGLGTVNHTLLTVDYARRQGLAMAGVILNGCRAGEERGITENAMMIETFSQVPVIGKLPWLEPSDSEAPRAAERYERGGVSETGKSPAWQRWVTCITERVDMNAIINGWENER